MIMRSFALLTAVVIAGPALADEQAVRAAGSDFESAVNAGDLDAMMALYSEDAVVLPPDAQMAEGRDAVREFWQGAVDADLNIDLEPVDITVLDDTAYEVGTFEGTVMMDGAETPMNGKFMVVWKQVDGNWVMHRDIWNMTPPEE